MRVASLVASSRMSLVGARTPPEVPFAVSGHIGHWNMDRTWMRLKQDLKDFPSGMKVLEVCCGLGSGHVALEDLFDHCASTFSYVGHYDLDAALRPLLLASGLSDELASGRSSRRHSNSQASGFLIASFADTWSTLSAVVKHRFSKIMG